MNGERAVVDAKADTAFEGAIGIGIDELIPSARDVGDGDFSRLTAQRNLLRASCLRLVANSSGEVPGCIGLSTWEP